MAATNDGFAIAERDLELRGPGDFFGTRQSGLPKLRTGDLVRDRDIMEDAHREARRLVDAGRPDAGAARVRAGAVAGAVRADRGRVVDGLTVHGLTVTDNDWRPQTEDRRLLVVRIIAGRFKGRRLKAPTWEACGRPPTSCARRCSTSWRRGSTARACSTATPAPARSGIEALSRGAAHVTFVEHEPPRRRADRGRTSRPAAWSRAILSSAATSSSVLRRLPAGRAFDLILLDPPYDVDDRRAMRSTPRPARLADGGLLVLERATRREPDVPESLDARPRREVRRQHADILARRRGPSLGPARIDDMPPARRTAAWPSFPARSIR